MKGIEETMRKAELQYIEGKNIVYNLTNAYRRFREIFARADKVME